VLPCAPSAVVSASHLACQHEAVVAVDFGQVQPRGVRQKNPGEHSAHNAGASRAVERRRGVDLLIRRSSAFVNACARSARTRVHARHQRRWRAGQKSYAGAQLHTTVSLCYCRALCLTWLKMEAARMAPSLPAAAEMPWKKARTSVGNTCEGDSAFPL